jgi:protein-S-isoprenylcysteine O-methyltransferase Ste14
MIVSTLQIVAWVWLGLCWFGWGMAFRKPRKQAQGQEKVVRAPSSRWGIFFNFLGFACIFPFIRPVGYVKPTWELVLSILIGPLAVLLAWSATRHLGKHWRFEAALSADHQLIQTGAYAWVRHPIYASMICMLLMTGFANTWEPLLIAGFVLFVIGVEIRVHAEDRLLEQRFQEEFAEYRSRVKAYIPFVR